MRLFIAQEDSSKIVSLTTHPTNVCRGGEGGQRQRTRVVWLVNNETLRYPTNPTDHNSGGGGRTNDQPIWTTKKQNHPLLSFCLLRPSRTHSGGFHQQPTVIHYRNTSQFSSSGRSSRPEIICQVGGVKGTGFVSFTRLSAMGKQREWSSMARGRYAPVGSCVSYQLIRRTNSQPTTHPSIG